jgi:adenylate cyclase
VSLERASNGQRLSHYRFRHLLVQRSAYGGLDTVARVRLHEATGRALEAGYGVEDRPATLARELARHYEAASLPLEAARQRLEAGRWAARLVAYDDAIAHLERGLALLEAVPASPERLRLELALCLAILMPSFQRRGWETQVAVQTLERLADLTQRPELEDDPQRLTALVVLAHGSTWSARPERGLQVGKQLLGLVQEGDRQAVMLAHWVVGNSLWTLGQFTAAREHLERVLALADREAAPPVSALLAGHPAILAGAALGHTLWALGYPEQGRAALRQAVAQAEAAGDRPSAAVAHAVAGIAHGILGRDWAAAAGHAAALRPLGEAGLTFKAWAELWARQAKAQLGQAVTGGTEPGLEPGLSHVAKARIALRAPGSGIGQASLLLMEARLLMGAGEAELAMEATDQARAWMERTGMRGQEAEAWRMRGELLLARSVPGPVAYPEGRGEAEACFRRALEVAREQGARWLELRAAVGLARLWQTKAERDEARELLAGIYGWFTEGFDTVDLVEAKALLEELR